MGISASLVIPAKTGIQERLGIQAKMRIYESACLPWEYIKMDIYARVALHLKVGINANLKNRVGMCTHAKMSFPERIDIDVKLDIYEKIGNPAKVSTDANVTIHTRINTDAKMGIHTHLAKDEHPYKQLRILAHQKTCRCNWQTKQKEHIQVKLWQGSLKSQNLQLQCGENWAIEKKEAGWGSLVMNLIHAIS